VVLSTNDRIGWLILGGLTRSFKFDSIGSFLDGEAVEVVLRFDPELRERMKDDIRKALGK